MKIRITPLDKIFSQYVRLRDKACQRCGSGKTACAHFHGRARKSVRWDEDNACALCFGCHSYLDSQAIDKVDFFKARLGEERFDLLNSRMRQTHPKPDQKLLLMYYQQKIEEMTE